MKLHLPVKLFRAILSLFATAPVLVPAALVADTITVDLSTQYRNIGVQLAPYVHKMDGNEYIFRIPRIDDPWASYVFEQVSLQTQSVQNNGLKPADASGTSNTSWYFTSLDPESPANININSMFSPNLINVVSNEGQDTYIQFDGLGRVDINSNNWYQYGNPSNDEAYYGNLFYLERGSLLFTNNTEVLLENNGHLNSPTGAICGVNSDGEGEIRFEGNGTVTISGNASGWDSFYDYAKPEGQQPPLGGAIVASSPLIFRNNGSITAQANKVRDSGSGAFVYSSSSVLFEGNESISLLGNTSASGGIVIDAPIITFAGNGDIVFDLNSFYQPKEDDVTLAGVAARSRDDLGAELRFENNRSLLVESSYGFYTDGLMSICNNDSVIFKVNYNNVYEKDYAAIRTPLSATVELSAARGSSIYIGTPAMPDRTLIYGLLNVNQMYGDLSQTGTVQILSSTLSEIGNAHVYDGAFVLNGGTFNGNVTVHPTQSGESESTFWLKYGAAHKVGTITVEAGGKLGVEEFGYTDDLVMKTGSTLVLHATDGNENRAGVLSATYDAEGTMMFEGPINLEVAIFNVTNHLKEGDRVELIDFSKATTNFSLDMIGEVTGLYGYHIDKRDLKFDIYNNALYVNYNGVSAVYIPEYFWKGDSGDVWGPSGDGAVWSTYEDSDLVTYEDGVPVVFTGSSSGTVELEGTVAPESIEVTGGTNYTFTGSGSIAGSADLTKSGTGTLIITCDNSYSGCTIIKGGTLQAASADALGSGLVSVQDATLQIGASGFDNKLETSGSSTIQVLPGHTLELSEAITGSGSLTLSGSIDASSLLIQSGGDTRIDVNGQETGPDRSGFDKRGEQWVVIAEPTIEVNGDDAAISYQDGGVTLNLTLGHDGRATAGGYVNYSVYHLAGAGDTATVSSILAAAQGGGYEGETAIDMSEGLLRADTTTDQLTSTGGTIELATEGVRLGGSISGAVINLSAGTLEAQIDHSDINVSGSGVIASTLADSTLAADAYNPGETITFDGSLTVTGSFDLTSHAGFGDLVETRLDVDGREGASGFLHIKSDAVVQLFEKADDEATLDISAASAFYKDTQLELHDDGSATLAPSTSYGTYYLTGDDSVSVSAVQEAAVGHLQPDESPMIAMDGGLLSADVSTDKLQATGGTIELATEGVTLGGSISDAVVHLSAGTLNASTLSNSEIEASGGVIASTFTGENTLTGSGDGGFALQNAPITNAGTLTLDGVIVADALQLTREEATHVDTEGNRGDSGFAKGALEAVRLVQNSGDSAVTLAGDSLVITHRDQTVQGALQLGSDGVASLGGETNYSLYTLAGEGDQASIAAVHAVSLEQIGQKAALVQSAGTLLADESTDQLTTTGGTIELATEGVTLGGSISGAVINLSAGTLKAQIDHSDINVSGSGVIASTLADSTLAADAYNPGETITFDGSLTVTGSFDLTSHAGFGDLVETRLDVDGREGASGFLHIKSDAVVQLFEKADDEATLDISAASAFYKDTQLELHDDGSATLAPSTSYGTYYLTGDDSVSVSAVQEAAVGHLQPDESPMIAMDGGLLSADVSTDKLQATGGTIELATEGVTLGGSISDAVVHLSAGTLNASTLSNSEIEASGGVIASTFTGENTLTGSGDGGFALQNAPITNAGTLTLDGVIVADALQLTREEATHVDTEGNRGDSGFAKGALEAVRLVQNSGDSAVTLAGDSLVITHRDQTVQGALQLGSDGVASLGGETNYSLYTLAGEGDQASIAAVHAVSLEQIGQKAALVQSAGTLLADESTDQLTTTGGTIELATEGVTLGGSISGAVINLSAGTLEAERLHDVEINASGSALINSTITGASTVRADGYKLSQAISLGEGSQLTLQGSVDLSQLELDMTSSGIQTLDGKLIEGAEGISGFAVDLSYSCTVVDVGAAASVTTQSPLHLSHSALMNGRELVLGADGIAVSSGNGVDYSTFFLYEDGIEYSAAQIAQVSAAQGGSLSGISMDGGVLNVDANARVFATGGEVNLIGSGADDAPVELSGLMRDITLSSQAREALVSAEITGESTVTVEEGVITLSANNSYTGATTVQGGKLVAQHAGALGFGEVTLFGGELDLGNLPVSAQRLHLHGGILSNAGAYDGTLNLNGGSDVTLQGDYTLSGGREIIVNEGGSTLTVSDSLALGGGRISLSGLLTVNGAVELVSGTTTMLNIGSWLDLDDGDVLVQFNGDQVSEDMTSGLDIEGAINATLEFDSETGELKLVYENPDQPLDSPDAWNLSLNQRRTEAAINAVVASQSATGELATLIEAAAGSAGAEEYKAALDHLAGTEYAVLMSTQIDGNMGHLRRIRNLMGSGQQMLTEDRRVRAYVGAYGDDVSSDGDSRGYGYDRHEYGTTFMLDCAVTEQLTLCLGFEYGSTNIESSRGMGFDEESERVDIGVVFSSGHFTSKTAVGLGFHNYDIRRNVGGMTGTASPDGSSVNFLQEFAWSFDLTEKSNVQVFASLESSYNDIDSYNESGVGTASLVASGQHAWATDITVGARYAVNFGAMTAAPEATFSCEAGVVVSVGDTTADTMMHFAGVPGIGFLQSSSDRDRVGGTVGFGLDIPMNDRISIGVGGRAVMRGDSHELNGNIGIRMNF